VTEGFDPQALLAQALEMQQRLLDAQAEAAAATVEGTSGGGKVVVTMTGTGDVTAVRLDRSVVDPDDVELLEDLIVAALHDAATKVGAAAEERLGPGLLGGVGDMFGLGGVLDASSTEADDEEQG